MPKAASARRKAVSGQQRRGWSGNKAFPAAGRVFIPQFRGVSAMPYSWLLPALCAAFLLVMSPASDATKVSVPIDKAIEARQKAVAQAEKAAAPKAKPLRPASLPRGGVDATEQREA